MAYKLLYMVLNDEGAIHGIEAMKYEVIDLALNENHILNIFGPFFSPYILSTTFSLIIEGLEKMGIEDIDRTHSFLLNTFFKFGIFFINQKLVVFSHDKVYLPRKLVISCMTLKVAKYFINLDGYASK